MASNRDTTEEKSLPASPRKLRELRKKGQISRSADMVAGVSTSVGLIFLYMMGGKFFEDFKQLTLAITRLDISSFNSEAIEAARAVIIGLGSFVASLMAVVLTVVILTNLLVNRGFLFSFDPIRFDLNRANPVEGFKRIFSLKTFIEISKYIIKTFLFLSLSILILILYFNAPFYVPFCGPDCLRTTFAALLIPFLILSTVIFLVFGLMDVGVQRWLFLRQQRMTKTEAKRERKDEEGAPEVRLIQRRARHRILQLKKDAPQDATIFIEGSNVIVGVRFVRGETPIPMVVSKGKGRQFSEIFDFAVENKVPTYMDDELANGLFQKIEIGGYLTETFFMPFIRALQALNLI